MKHKPQTPAKWTKILPWRKRLEEKAKPKVAILNLHGMIANSSLNRRNLSIHSTQKLIDKAFDTKKCEAVFLSINSPGGSAVQSELIADYIGQKSAEKKVPVISFVEDVAASGGYWLATAAPTIYCSKRFFNYNEITFACGREEREFADFAKESHFSSGCRSITVANLDLVQKDFGTMLHLLAFDCKFFYYFSSIIGSIGVISQKFGFHEAIKHLGIERRTQTAGEFKAFGDPFKPEQEKDVAIVRNILSALHENFKAQVKSSRKDKLKEAKAPDSELFSGKVYTIRIKATRVSWWPFQSLQILSRKGSGLSLFSAVAFAGLGGPGGRVVGLGRWHLHNE